MIYSIFLNHVLTTPEKIALVDSRGVAYTYAQTQDRIHRWANYFILQGIEAGDRVAVLLDDEDDHLFIFLALDRINACYVPFDIDIPKEQVLLDIPMLELKKFINLSTLDIPINKSLFLAPSEEHLQDATEPTRIYQTDGHHKITYIVSSSGTTGSKRWIPILGAGLLYWATTEKELFQPYPVKSVLCTRSPAYDARISEVVRAFAHGAPLHLLPYAQRKDLSSILLACKNKTIDCLLLTASQLQTNNIERCVAELEVHGVQHLMVTGDACSLELKHWCEYYEINLWNCYGPTEATFGLSILRLNHLYPCNSDDLYHPIFLIPIGKPHGLDVHFELIEGQLFIRSPYMTPGYLGKNEAIELFATGDECYEHEGYLIYKGRYSDESHCKIDGVKVDWKRIEQCIMAYSLQYPGHIIQAIVVIKHHLDAYKPFAYLLTSPDFDTDALAQQRFLTYLHDHLSDQEFPMLIQIKSKHFPMPQPVEKLTGNNSLHASIVPKTSFLSDHHQKRSQQAQPFILSY